ncbi:MAG: aldehyde dehydrogenase family protein [Eubacterium sp.]|jgi:NAD-dependent aldehyde dehydrogenases|nr:aldehyde dehydrogenase family protein [Eubacterium sp.]
MNDQETREYIARLLKKARVAQTAYSDHPTQAVYDKAARACAKTVYDNAEQLAVEAVEETKMGSVEGKVAKMQMSMTAQWHWTKDKKSTGVLGWKTGKLDVNCILEIAKPAGVICAVMPSTNPTANIGSNTMQALKGGNAIIICPHPSAKNVSLHCTDMIRASLKKLGVPEDLVQCVAEPSILATQECMSACNLVVATGGPGIVDAANRSGTPNYGVGQGNCQVIVDRGMNEKFDFIAEGSITCRSWDSGIPCTSDQTVIVPEEDKEEIMAAYDRHGAVVITDKVKVDKMREILFTKNEKTGEYAMNRAFVGKPIKEIGEAIGVEVPEGKRTFLVEIEKYGEEELLCKEKLTVVTNIITYKKDWEEAVHIAKTNLLMEGAGHSTDIYTNDKDHELYAGLEIPVCRLIINNNNLACSGEPYHSNGLVSTHGLGGGFFQGNITSEHVNFSHMLNITRMVYTVPYFGKELTPEEIWAE